MPERSMPQIVTKRNSFGKILVEPQRHRYRPSYLRHLQSMREPRPVMVAHRREKHLRLMLEPPKRLGMYYPVSVSLKIGAYIALLLLPHPAAAVLAQTRKRRQLLRLVLFGRFPNVHLDHLPK